MAVDVRGRPSAVLAHSLHLGELLTPRPHPGWHSPVASPHTYASHVPNLILQEVHVPVKQGVGRRQDAHRLHPGATLQLTLHGHVGEAGEAEEGPLSEIARKDPKSSVAHHQREISFGFVF